MEEFEVGDVVTVKNGIPSRESGYVPEQMNKLVGQTGVIRKFGEDRDTIFVDWDVADASIFKQDYDGSLQINQFFYDRKWLERCSAIVAPTSSEVEAIIF